MKNFKKDSRYCPKHVKSNYRSLLVSVIVTITLIAIFTVAINAKEPEQTVKVTAFASTEIVETTTVPVTTVPVTTVPVTTVPATTAPVTTVPATTAPATTEPPTEAPKEPKTDIVGQGSQNGLIAIENPDPNYQGAQFTLNNADRETLRHVIMGEAGGEGYLGCCVLAQTIRDNWIRGGYTSAEAVRIGCQYNGWSNYSNADVEAAIRFVFDEGGNAVQHRLCFMYNPVICRSDWHETQNYILSYGDVRYFDAW